MQFREEVQKQFERAGWFPGRNVKQSFEGLEGFDQFPSLVKEFLSEYGNLKIEIVNEYTSDIWDTHPEYLFGSDNALKRKRYFSEKDVYPLGYYDGAPGFIESDTDGKLYIASDGPNLMSEDFIEGIERLVMQDYYDVHWWDDAKNRWSQDKRY